MKKFNILVLILLSIGSVAQEKLTLEQCYNLVQTNYPLAKKTALLTRKYCIPGIQSLRGQGKFQFAKGELSPTTLANL